MLGYLFVHVRKIRMFYVALQDVGRHKLRNYYYLNISVLVLHLRKLHGCSDSFHKPNHLYYVCEHSFMNWNYKQDLQRHRYLTLFLRFVLLLPLKNAYDLLNRLQTLQFLVLALKLLRIFLIHAFQKVAKKNVHRKCLKIQR